MKSVAQHYDLMPYSTVYDNVGKFLSNIDLKAKKDKVYQLLEIVGLEDYMDEYPKNLRTETACCYCAGFVSVV
jgi:ABC-type nitrate/sulfonate/bicarbonate transport system ATPase subunit